MAHDCTQAEHYHHHHHVHPGGAEGLSQNYAKKLRIAMVLALLYFVAQAIGSAYSGSLALMAEAGHKLADIGSIALALFAAWFAILPPSPRKTFGYYRMEILAALANGCLLLFTAVYILYEAYERVYHGGHAEIEGGIMMAVALFGLVLNVCSAWILFPAKDENLNVKGALFHILADILGSAGTIVTALGIYFFRLNWLDTVISVVISLMVMTNALRVLKEALNILMESAPRRLSVDEIQSFLAAQPNVLNVHDLHVWTITTSKEALLAHVQVSEDAFGHDTVVELEKSLRDRFGLCHITLQLEPAGYREAEILF